ncbi:TadE/TadG family type IV pilus assembly protein [Streptomyces albireticuli]|uniref:Septum formation initiator n=1 Tax=Streptomyces albireticuli TaxID=1940 RepID=A0A2A2CYH3_9ACTN|nr:TadE/TadG family type IV pilus assembly protein [Streptomyces albireticuli]PAU44257.1 septum formation initiator [Streptomyces albireticuli]
MGDARDARGLAPRGLTRWTGAGGAEVSGAPRTLRPRARWRADAEDTGQAARARPSPRIRACLRSRPDRDGPCSRAGRAAGYEGRTGAGARAPGGGARGRTDARARVSRRPVRDRGTASIEFLGFLPVLLLVGLAAVQLGLAAYAAQQAGSAARAAARTATLDDPRTSPGEAGRAALSGWLRTDGSAEAPPCDGGARTTATVTVEIPAVLPFLGDRTVTRRATMACPSDAGPYPNPRSAP